jgi:4-amino-4-deoxy-L-arabinose transferase-like glycosyltransferase
MSASSRNAYRRGVTTLVPETRRRVHVARLGVAPACLATVAVHLCLLRRALGPDEGGFSVIAQHWREPGAFLYGPLWVDRPPGLIALFAVADRLGPFGPRLVVTALAVALVALVGRVADAVAGPRAVPWATWTAFALGSSVLLQAQQLNGEYAAVVCVTAAMLLTVRALQRPAERGWLLGAGAGLAAGLAVLMKQNFLDGYVFGGLLLGVTAATRPEARRRVMTTALGAGVGTVAIGAATFVWASRHGGASALLSAMYGFRLRAAAVIQQGPLTGPDQRSIFLLLLCLVTGLLVLAAHLAWHGRHALRNGRPLAWALAGTVGFELASLLGGANFWPHYTLAFIPALSIGAGIATGEGRAGWRETRRIVAGMAVLTAVISPIAAVTHPPGEAWTVGRWVKQSSTAADSIVVTYTHPNVVDASGLRPGYPYVWSLPIRVLDPHLALLTSSLDSPAGATWVVVWDPPQMWDLNRAEQLNRALHEHYDLVAHVCGHPVWLRSNTTRELAPLPEPAACEGGAL